jgi:beta-lactam-binding protein with PASTA domain
VTVSTGQPEHVKVPYLKSLKLQAAKDKLTSLGLKWKHLTGPGDGMLDVGYVYKQIPAPNKVVDVGSTVDIYTWNGP